MSDLMKQFEKVKARYKKIEDIETKKCPYCFSDIPSVARKCRYCGEFTSRWRMHSQSLWATGIIMLVIFILIITNPSKSDFNKYFDSAEEVNEEVDELVRMNFRDVNSLAKILSIITGSEIINEINQNTQEQVKRQIREYARYSLTRMNLLVYSYYSVDFYELKFRYIGILTKFIRIK